MINLSFDFKNIILLVLFLDQKASEHKILQDLWKNKTYDDKLIDFAKMSIMIKHSF